MLFNAESIFRHVVSVAFGKLWPQTKNSTSKYMIWITKENDLPHRLRRKMEHSPTEAVGSHFIYKILRIGKSSLLQI